MSEAQAILAESQSKEAVNAAAVAAEANDKARYAQMVAAMGEVLGGIFGGGSENPQQMTVLVRRIPLLCTNVEHMHASIDEMKEIIKDRAIDHETRLRAIEKNMWKWIGVLMIVPPVVTILIAIIISTITRMI